MYCPIVRWLVWTNLGEHADENPPHIRLLGSPHKCPAFELLPKLAVKFHGKCRLPNSSKPNNGHNLKLLMVPLIMGHHQQLFELFHSSIDTNISLIFPTRCAIPRGGICIISTAKGSRASNGVKVIQPVLFLTI